MEPTRAAADATPATVLPPEAIAALPALPLGDLAGVEHRVLWQDGTSMVGVMTVSAGHRLGEHAHRANQHHMWVLEGHASILGTLVGPGAYVHIPVALVHDIDATATEGCTVLYHYIR